MMRKENFQLKDWHFLIRKNNNMKKILWTGEAYREAEELFKKEFEIEKYGYALSGKNEDALTQDEEDTFIDLLKDKDAIVIGYDMLTEKVLKSCPNLKVVLSVRDGPEENIDIKTCTELGIPVLSAGGRCARAVAELTLMNMFMLARRYIPLQRYMELGEWTKYGYGKVDEIAAESEELGGKTLGLVGLGRNGMELCKLALGIGMKVIAYDPYVDLSKVPSEIDVKAELLDVMKNADYFSILARVTKNNLKMIGRKEIYSMKPSACFINTGRTALVDMEALYDALENNVIRAAALDVFTEEPPLINNRIYSFGVEKLIITPHIGGTTKERIPHQYHTLYSGLEKLKKHEAPINLVNPDVMESKNFKLS